MAGKKKQKKTKRNIITGGALPLSVVCITVALELWVNTRLVDGTAALLDLSESSSPVVVTFVVATNPVTEWSSIYVRTKFDFIKHIY